jgi:hypothetical protein
VAYAAQVGAGRVRKSIALDDARLHVAYRFEGMGAGVFRVTLNIAMPSCDGPAGRFRIGEEIMGGFGQLLSVGNLQHIALEDAVLGGKLKVVLSRPVSLLSQPCFSVSQSEAGFEKIMQAVVLVFECQLAAQDAALEFALEVE